MATIHPRREPRTVAEHTMVELPAQLYATACTLTYQSDREAPAKQLMFQASLLLRRLDVYAVQGRPLVFRDGLGRTRSATWREQLAYWISGALPREL